MDGQFAADAALNDTVESPLIEATSSEYLGRWNRLVSTTNWEKGRILCEWRDALIAAGAPPGSYTDEAWSQRVGNVSPQHVGRLRRVYQKFGPVQAQYAGLYWSHFQIALDWPDAEMWLEGAVQNGWSISQMQTQRSQTLGSLDAAPEGNETAADFDEDASATASSSATTPPEVISPSDAVVHAADDDSDDRDVAADGGTGPSALEAAEAYADQAPPDPVRPFENLPLLPADLAEAFEAFKLAIVHHRLAGWTEVSCDDVLAALGALRQLAMAPA